MARSKSFLKRNLVLFLILIILPFRLYNIRQPLVNITNFRQAQTATVVLNFYKNGINLFRTELDIFGMGKEKYLTLEFPLYEAIVAIFYKIFFVHDMWGRVVSVIAGILGAIYLCKLVILLFKNKKLAFFSSFFFLFMPLNMFYQQDFLIETTVIFFILAGAYYFCHFVKYQNKLSSILAIFFLSLGFIQKGMYGPFWLLPLSWYYVRSFVPSHLRGGLVASGHLAGGTLFRINSYVKYILLVGIPLTVLFLWQRHVNYINTIHGHDYFTTYSKGQLLWNFGTLSDRISLSLWQVRLRQILNGIFLKPGLLMFLMGLFSLFRIKNKGFLYTWFFSQIIYFMIFFRIQSHIYYQMVMTPVISLFMAGGLIRVVGWIHDRYGRLGKYGMLRKYIKPLFLTLFCTVFIWRSWISSRWNKYADLAWHERLQAVGKSVPKNSYGILANPGYDWNSVYTYYPKLKLMAIGVEDLTLESIGKWQDLGYSYIVLHEYEEYPAYLKEAKPGHSIEFMEDYRKVLTLEDFKVYLID